MLRALAALRRELGLANMRQTGSVRLPYAKEGETEANEMWHAVCDAVRNRKVLYGCSCSQRLYGRVRVVCSASGARRSAREFLGPRESRHARVFTVLTGCWV